jgi:hypothetical protein
VRLHRRPLPPASPRARSFPPGRLRLALLLLPLALSAAAPEYQLGDVATEDVLTPLPLVVVNQEATDALRLRVAQEVRLVVRFNSRGATEAERDLREAIVSARARFLSALQRALPERLPGAADIGTPAFELALREALRDAPRDFPLERLARTWVKGEDDATLIERLLTPLREAMAQPIVATKDDRTYPSGQTVLLAPEPADGRPLDLREIERSATPVSTARLLSLWRARRLVETQFRTGDEDLARFVVLFVKPTASAEPGLTEVLRSRRQQGLTVNDSYDAAQPVVRKGQVIDRKALAALSALREKSAIGSLQTRLEQERTFASQLREHTVWLALGLAGLGLALALIIWRTRTRPSAPPLMLDGQLSLPPVSEVGPGGQSDWRTRALLAEDRAARAQNALRSGALGWMKERVVGTLFRHRSELLSAQERAEAEMRALELRLEQLHTPLAERLRAYERRIEDLERELAARGEENRELIGARIAVTRSHLSRERERGGFDPE